MKSASVETPWPAGSLALPANETGADRTIDMRIVTSFKTTLIVLSVTGVAFLASAPASLAADSPKKNQEPPVVDPGPVGGPPSDALVLFDGKDLSQFRGERSPEPKWKLENGVAETTPGGGIF